MEKGDIIQTKIVDMTSEGSGLGRVDGLAVFISGAVIGDEVKARITKLKKNFAYADLAEVVDASEHRIEPICPAFGKCGGCDYLNMDYETQLLIKHKQVADKLVRIAGLEAPVVRETVGGQADGPAAEGTDCGQAGEPDCERLVPFKYRNKAEYQARKGLVGFHEKKSHRIVDVEECWLQAKSADVVSMVIRELGQGKISKVTVKTAFGTGAVMVVLEMAVFTDSKGKARSASLKPEAMEELVYALDEEISSIGYSLESVYTLSDGKYKSVAGSRTIIDEVEFADGKTLSFEISAPSFYQVNYEQMKKLYEIANAYAALKGNETVLDLYCGIGTIGLSMADKAEQVIGIESVKAATLDANRNSVINGILNTRYICGTAEGVLENIISTHAEAETDPEIEAEGGIKLAQKDGSAERLLEEALFNEEKEVVAVLDPPRAGCDEILLKSIAQAGVNRIVYISCDPGTLSRDIKFLSENGYNFVEATPVDMFPHTTHVETCVLITRVEK